MFSSKVQHYLARTVSICLKTLFLVIIIRFFMVSPGRVEGPSMEPTLKNQQLFLVNRAVLLFREPKRYEVVDAFDPQETGKYVIKRVIGLPGEKVIFKENKVFIQPQNGAEFALEEAYLPKDIVNQPEENNAEITVPPLSYFILGDNREYSYDSRFYGPVLRSQINGKVIGL